MAPTWGGHKPDLGDPVRDRTAVPMRNELPDREPAVSPAQPPVQADVVSAGEAQPSIDAMAKGLPRMAGSKPSQATFAPPGLPPRAQMVLLSAQDADMSAPSLQ